MRSAQAAEVSIVSLTPGQTGQAEVCLTCHLGMEGTSASHPVEAFGCVSCHGGQRLALDKDAAHTGLVGDGNPGRLDAAARLRPPRPRRRPLLRRRALTAATSWNA